MKYPFSTSSYSAFIVVLAYLHNFCFGGVSSVEYPISCYTKKGCPTQKKSTLSIKSFKSIKSFCGRFVNLVTYPYAKRKFNLKKRKYCSESGNVTVEHQIYKQYSSEGGVARYSTKMDASKLNYLGQTDWDFNFSNMNKEWEKGFKESSSDESDFEGKTLSVFDSIESLPYAPSIDSLLFVPHCPGEKDGNVKQESTRCPEITRTGGSKPVTLESNIEPVTSKSSEPTFARDKKQRTESESSEPTFARDKKQRTESESSKEYKSESDSGSSVFNVSSLENCDFSSSDNLFSNINVPYVDDINSGEKIGPPECETEHYDQRKDDNSCRDTERPCYLYKKNEWERAKETII